ncbi:unnamed protein product [Bursaphelenchus okinawaensis]|uniref:7TM_GPCR_Srx domain-containing protein n=1 Tax=Bursaphelenchus okinawaensis TaxID=465554 RepID=A0A811JQ04_9BILA|nr:unnamed protein product [Bursaphelenchus okinawaensis]CAG9077368.1 unnamed protein product [Bursaphelenchus okinawaensis]
MTKEQSQDYCCCGLFHKHTLAFVAGVFLSVSYGIALARRIYTASTTPNVLDTIIILAAGIGFIVHVMMVIGNRNRSKGFYWPAIVFNVIWCLDQARAAFFHINFIVSVLRNAEDFYKAARVPHTYEKFISLVILDLFTTIGGVIVALGFFYIIVAGYRYLSREQNAAKVVQVENPVYSNGPEKSPITNYI